MSAWQPRAIIFDLFGTLVDAPTGKDRRLASQALTTILGSTPATVESLLRSSWNKRHDGSLPTLTSLARFISTSITGSNRSSTAVETILARAATRRLVCDASVLDTLAILRQRRIRLGVVSDASADIAAVWDSCRIRGFVDVAVFSASIKALKPSPLLYHRAAGKLNVAAEHIVYCGDGGGDELHGAQRTGMRAVAVESRGGTDVLTFGATSWEGDHMSSMEDMVSYLGSLASPR